MSEGHSTRKLPAWMTGQVQNSPAEVPPTLAFPGVVKYCPTVDDMGLACETLISQADQSEGLLTLALDAEWPVYSQIGPGKIALIQVCCDENTCYLFHVSCMNGLPKIFQNLIKHPKVQLVGNNVINDIWKIGRDYNIHVAKLVGSGRVVDLGDFANAVLCCSQTWSLDRLALHLLSVTVPKTELIRKSRWDLELSPEQKLYAATDAYVSLAIYNKLKAKQDRSQGAPRF